MASWDDSGPRVDDAAAQPQKEADNPTPVERTRRLLKQLLARQARGDQQ